MDSRFQLDPAKLVNDLEIFGNDLAHKRNERRLLEEKKKIVLGQITTQFIVTEGSHAAAEKAALASKQYEGYVERLVKAHLAEDLAEVKYEKHRVYIDLLRSVAALNREAMKHIGIQT